MAHDSELARTIGLPGAVALAVGIVVGAGMLSLPGLVQAAAGDWAPVAWVANALLVIPLLGIFAWLGRRHSGCGGIVGFAAAAAPWARRSVGYLLLGTFSLGLPAIALTGAAYVAEGVGIGADHGPAVSLLAAGLLLVPFLAAWRGARTADRLQQVVVAVLTVVLMLVAFAGLLGIGAAAPLELPSMDVSPLPAIWAGMTLAFFAFTGWEMLAFTTGEFRNPRRDFPLAIAISFVIVVTTYVGVALAVARLDSIGVPETALLQVVAALVGPDIATVGGVVTVAAIIVVNLNGAVWGASRLVYSMARDGDLPEFLGAGRLSGGVPRRALTILAVVFGILLATAAAELLTLEGMLRLAGQNFFILYLITVAAFVKLATGLAGRLFGVATAAICVVFMGGWGWTLLYPAVLLALPAILPRAPVVIAKEQLP